MSTEDIIGMISAYLLGGATVALKVRYDNRRRSFKQKGGDNSNQTMAGRDINVGEK
jgi:hypothetical protein